MKRQNSSADGEDGTTPRGVAAEVVRLKGHAFEENDPSLSDYVATLTESRWTVLGIALAALAIAIAYVFLATPQYRADILVQVEDTSSSSLGLDALPIGLEERTPADTEMEIIRSRYLLGAVVDQLSLDVAAEPRVFPIVGGAWFRRYDEDEVRQPVLGLSRYAWGGERIRVERLTVPPALLGRPLVLVALENDRFEVQGPGGDKLLEGELAKAATGKPGRKGEPPVEIFVSELRARPGTEFLVTRMRRDAFVAELKTRLRISEMGKKTGMIEVALEGADPQQLAATLDAIAMTYLRQNVERKSAESQKKLEFLESQLPIAKSTVDAAELAIEQYRKVHGSVDVSLETKAAIDRTVEIEKTLTDLKAQATEFRQRFTETHPALTAVNEKVHQLEGARATLDARLKKLPTAELASARLIRDAKVASELYVLLLNKAQELRVLKEGTIGNVRVLDKAILPFKPVAPKKGATIVLSLVLGLAAGVAVAFTKRALLRGLDDPDLVERETGLAVYATIPHSAREDDLGAARRSKSGPSVLAVKAGDEVAIEALRSLRTTVQFALVDTASNVLTCLGTAPSVGKSFVAVNLAHVVAETGTRVVLVDADMRKGRLHRCFGQRRDGGLAEAISGILPVADAIRRTPAAGLDFVASGRIAPNPSALLASARFQRLLAELSRMYDLVIVDTPPILAVTDAALVGRLAGVNLLVLRAGKHPAREVTTAIKRFEQGGARITGAVMNDVRSGPGYRNYFYYGYDRNKVPAAD